jgi:tRNA pseudouridine13 synthase
MANGLPRALIKRCPEDFIVEEIPAYAPSGNGNHVFVRLTKRGLTTLDAVDRLARAIGCDPREAGFAGMKDKYAVTTQTVSFNTPKGDHPDGVADRARKAQVGGIAVLDATPHENKLKPGHLLANRFAIALRDLDPAHVLEVTTALARIAREGVPNAFGRQRYGTRGDNVSFALAWLRGEERGPKDPRRMRLLWSAVQSAVFDDVLASRVADGTYTTPLEGDLLKLHGSGGMFLCTDPATDRSRAVTGELSPTGPIVGARMRWPEGEVLDREKRASASVLGDGFDMERTRRLGEGTRRALRVWVQELRWELTEPQPQVASEVVSGDRDGSPHAAPAGHPDPRLPVEGSPIDEDTGHRGVSMWVYFMLTKGAYATTVLEAAVVPEEPGAGDHGSAHPAESLEPMSDAP